MLIEAIAIGLVYGFALFEYAGVVAGGLVAPGYLAMYFNQPWTVAAFLATALLTFGIVRLLSCVTLLYGRRRFLVCVLVSFFVEWILVGTLMQTDFGRGSLDLVGYIIPGLLANEMERQGVGITLLAFLTLSSLVWLTLRVFGLA